MDETILLNNGALINNAHCIESDGRLFVYINNSEDISGFFNLFIEPENTEIIKADRYGEKAEYTGYTDLYSISKEYGNINLVLRKG